MDNTIFLERSYRDSIEFFEQCVKTEKYKPWDYVVITAGNRKQAKAFKMQLDKRKQAGLIDARSQYLVVTDCGGERIGSGGGTLNALAELTCNYSVDFKKSKVLLIHSGGDSKRIPQYSICGKLFSPVHRGTPIGSSALFDELLASVTLIPERMKEGLVVMSGDVMLLFNQLQVDFTKGGAYAVSMLEKVETGKNHGVFLTDEHENMVKFLHKLPADALKACGAVDTNGLVKIDTGMIYFDGEIIDKILSLLKQDNKIDEKLFKKYVNNKVRLNFYSDFIYPLSLNADYDSYINQQGEAGLSEALIECRKSIWQVLYGRKLDVITLSPAKFLHFGTTKERYEFASKGIESFKFLGWEKAVNSYGGEDCTVCDSLVIDCIAKNAYIEKSRLKNCIIGDSSVISCIAAENLQIPSDVAMSGARLEDGSFITRIYGIYDDIKVEGGGGACLLGKTITELPQAIREELESRSLWDAEIYVSAETEEKASENAVALYRWIFEGIEMPNWRGSHRYSLASSFNLSDVAWHNCKEQKLYVEINDYSAIKAIKSRENESFDLFSNFYDPNDVDSITRLAKVLEKDYSSLIRLYYFAGRLATNKKTAKIYYDTAFKVIAEQCIELSPKNLTLKKFIKEVVEVALPARVNFAGGWTDTPPYCVENGGTVLNSAVKINGMLPIRACARVIREKAIILNSRDSDISIRLDDRDAVLNCNNPFDVVALPKAALKVTGIVSESDDESLFSVYEKMGGGILLETEVIGIPRGSGLGTSSILSAACVKALYELMGIDATIEEISEKVFLMEQIMSTGGGWQDQIGGLLNGVKFIKSRAGIQNLDIEHVNIPDETKAELKKRVALIYTGQRRLARNLLREVVGGYLMARSDRLHALKTIEEIACLMKRELERGDIDAFSKLLSRHWEYSVMLDKGSTNSFIDHIFSVIEDNIDGKMICGAGGGGFLQVVLKKGVSHEEVQNKLDKTFGGCVKIWDSELML